MKKREDCEHDSVYFGSGDLFVFCQECGASWCMYEPTDREMKSSPDTANKGKGMYLSGKIRKKAD
jgi:ribosomal protein S27E